VYQPFGSPNNEMTQTNSAIIAAIKPSMEYATLRMSMRLATSAIRHDRTSAIRRASTSARGGAVTALSARRALGGDALLGEPSSEAFL
jgi:hypothetical protein